MSPQAGDVFLWALRCPDGAFRHRHFRYTRNGHNNALIDAHQYTVSPRLCNLHRIIASECAGGVHVVELISVPETDAEKMDLEPEI